MAALRRELAEELGVRVAVGAELTRPGGGAWALPGVGPLRVWWAAPTAGRPAPLEDHDELRWLPAGTWADAVAWLPGDLPVVAALEAGRPR